MSEWHNSTSRIQNDCSWGGFHIRDPGPDLSRLDPKIQFVWSVWTLCTVPRYGMKQSYRKFIALRIIIWFSFFFIRFRSQLSNKALIAECTFSLEPSPPAASCVIMKASIAPLLFVQLFFCKRFHMTSTFWKVNKCKKWIGRIYVIPQKVIAVLMSCC